MESLIITVVIGGFGALGGWVLSVVGAMVLIAILKALGIFK